MGLLEFLRSLFGANKIQCPSCSAPGATRSSDGLVHCRNPVCPYFDPLQRRGDFRPQHPVSIRYRNAAGQDRNFSAERDSIVRKGNHLVARVAPTGEKIALSRDRIQNLSSVEAAFPQPIDPGQPWPAPRERQILGYHKKHGTTSPRYDQVRAKYPNW